MKIAIFEIKGWEQKYMEKKLKGHDLKFFEEPLNKDTVSKARGCDAVSVFIYSKVTKDVIDTLPKLKMITTRSTGFDHVNVKHANKKNITVTSVPFYGENTVAEYAFALMISLSRKIHLGYSRTRLNNFSIEGMKGFDLKGKIIGIIGGGHIGMHMARMCKAFDMKVIVFDIFRNEFMKDVVGFEYVDMDTLYKKSDIITLHVPDNEHTHHMINKEAIKKMKKGVTIINTARGGVIDTDALYDGLMSNKIHGAGLDVIEGEELLKEEKDIIHNEKHGKRVDTLMRDHKIFSHDNVIFTPHTAFFTQEALERILDTTVENLENFSAGKGHLDIVKA